MNQFKDKNVVITGGSRGIGLSIAKTIIELHEGNLTLNSNKKGTSLIMSLPLIKKSS